MKSDYLEYITSASIAATRGKTTILGKSEKFEFLDSYFNYFGTDIPSIDTARAQIDVFELKKDAQFGQMFGSLGDIKNLQLTQGQIVRLCVMHRHLLNETRFTFIPFAAGEQNFVALVSRFEKRIEIRIRPYPYNAGPNSLYYGSSGHRLIVLRQ